MRQHYYHIDGVGLCEVVENAGDVIAHWVFVFYVPGFIEALQGIRMMDDLDHFLCAFLDDAHCIEF